MSESKSTDRREWYLASFRGFERSLNGGTASSLHRIRRAAIDCFAETGFPSRRDESWRHTNIAPVVRTSFRDAPDSPPPGLSADQLAPFTYPGLVGTQLVFVDGHFAPSLSSRETALSPHHSGVVVGSMATALKEVPDLVEPHLGHHAPFVEEGFAALNTAFIRDGAFVYLPTYSVYKGNYRSSGQEFRAGFERGCGVIMCQVCPAQCAAVAWQDSGVVDGGGKGSYRVGGVIFERRSPLCRRWHTALLFEFFRRRSRGFVAAGGALGTRRCR